MADLTPILPRQQASLVDGAGFPVQAWYEFFRLLLNRVNADEALTAEIEAILAQLAALLNTQIVGPQSVQVFGSLSQGLVTLMLRNDEPLPSPLFYYGTDPVGNKGWQPAASLVEYMVDENGDYLVDENGNFLISVDITADLFAIVATDTPGLLMHTGVGTWETLEQGPGITLDTGEPGAEIRFNADTGEIAHLTGATYSTVQKFIDVMHSPGLITGGSITTPVLGTIRVGAGTMMVRIADDNVSTMPFADFAQTDFSVPADQDTRFFGVVYNAGSPIVEMRTVFDWDKDTEIPLGSAVRFNGTTVITNNPYRTGDPITNIIQRFDAVSPAQRDNSVGGLMIGETGTRNVTVTAGRIWSRLDDYLTISKNSSVDTMVSVFYNGAGFTFTSGVTQWDNQNYNDLGTGTLVAVGNNKYANLWFFMSIDGSQYGFAYGTADYNTVGDAANEGIPSYLTQDFFNQSILLGRFIFQESAATAAEIESAFEALFSSSAINTHNDLGGLQGGTTGEFYHLTAAEYTALQAGYQPLDATLTALAGQNWAANAVPIGSGADTVAQVAFAANTFPARASTGNLVAKAITDFGLSLVDDASASAARTTLGIPTLDHGTYTPTLTGIANVDSATPQQFQYMRVGNTVTVSGRIDVDATAAGSTLTQVGISLPIASNLAATTNLAGAGGAGTNPYEPALIIGDTANDRATFAYYSTTTASVACLLTFTYLVI